MRLPCFGKYHKRKFRCRWLCGNLGYLHKCIIETADRQGLWREPEVREQNPGSRLASRMNAALNRQRHEPHVQRGNPMRPAGEAVVFFPTDSTADDTGTTRAGEEATYVMEARQIDQALPCFGNYHADAYVCITTCLVAYFCQQTVGATGPVGCFRRYNAVPADYHDEFCTTCEQRRLCIRLDEDSILPAGSSFALEPTGSAAVDTGATRVGEETTMEMRQRDSMPPCFGNYHADLYTCTITACSVVYSCRQEGEESNMDSKDFEARKTKARKLEVVSVSDDFMVKSSTRQGGYMVTPKEGGGYHCACMDFALHRSDSEWKCKHIMAVEDYVESRGPTNGDSRFDLLDLK